MKHDDENLKRILEHVVDLEQASVNNPIGLIQSAMCHAYSRGKDDVGQYCKSTDCNECSFGRRNIKLFEKIFTEVCNE
jgi:hypothetical protein